MKQQLGILRSFLMYYGIPGRHGRLTRFYSQFIQPGDLCFDVGAHMGNRSRIWAGLGATVIAIEPQPQLMRWLQRLYGRQPHITLLQTAVGSQAGSATLHISQGTPTVSTLSRNWITAVQQDPSFANVKWDTAVTVPVTTLDALIAQYGRPAFCKIDVEGFELDVLKGLSQPLRSLSFEAIAATRDTAVACLQRLETLAAYQYNYSAGESHHLHFEQWQPADKMADFLTDLTTGSGDVYGRIAP
jgi:FkbM family methyltransferase